MIMDYINKKILFKSEMVILYSVLAGICAALGSAITCFAYFFIELLLISISDIEINHHWDLVIILSPAILGAIVLSLALTLKYREGINFLSCVFMFFLYPLFYVITFTILLFISIFGIIYVAYHWGGADKANEINLTIINFFYWSFFLILSSNRLVIIILDVVNKDYKKLLSVNNGLSLVFIYLLASNLCIPSYIVKIFTDKHIVTSSDWQINSFINMYHTVIDNHEKGYILSISHPFSKYYDFKTKKIIDIKTPKLVEGFDEFSQPIKFNNGNILFLESIPNGSVSDTLVWNIFLFDRSTLKFKWLKKLILPRYIYDQAINDDKIFITYNLEDIPNNNKSETIILNIKTGHLTIIKDIPVNKWIHKPPLSLGNGKIFLSGYKTSVQNNLLLLSCFYIFDAKLNKFLMPDPNLADFDEKNYFLLKDHRILARGKNKEGKEVYAIYDQETNALNKLDYSKNQPVKAKNFIQLDDGRVLITDEDGAPRIFDPSTNKFIKLSDDLALLNKNYSLTPVAKDKIIAFDYNYSEDSQYFNLQSIKIYNLKTGECKYIGNVVLDSPGPSVIKLPDNKLIIYEFKSRAVIFDYSKYI